MNRARRKLLLPRRGLTPSLAGSASKTGILTTLTVAQADFNVTIAPGHLLVAFASTASDDPDLASASFGITGWTLLASTTFSGPVAGLSVFTRVAGASEGSYVFDTGGASQACLVQIAVVADAPPSGWLDSFDIAQLSAGSTSQPAPVINSSRPGALGIAGTMGAWGGPGANAWTQLSTSTEDRDATIDQTNFTVSGCMSHRTQALAGSTGPRGTLASRATPAFTAAAAVLIRGL